MGKRLIHFDVLRGVAVLMVIGRHQSEVPASACGRLFLSAWQRCGWAGVDLFFCLSGFLVGGLLFDEFRRHDRLDVARFYTRRALKIWPAYLAFLAAGISAALLHIHHSGPLLTSVWPNLLHAQNYCGTPWPHTWSLAVEEHFYLILPLMLLGMIRGRSADPFRRLPVLLVAVMAFCLTFRLFVAGRTPGFDLYRNLAPTHLRIDSLLAGVTLGYYVHFRGGVIERLRPWRTGLLLAGIASFVPTMIWDIEATPFLYTYGLSLLIFGSICLTLWSWLARPTPPGAGWPMRCLAAIGVYSYSIYLWHVPFASRAGDWAADRLVPADSRFHPLILVACFVGISVALGMLLYRAIEWPMLALRNRAFPSPAASAFPPDRMSAEPARELQPAEVA